MSEEQLKAFLEKVKGDTTLQDKLKAAKSPEDVVAIAKEHGHEFSLSHAEATARRLSEKELEVLVGGGGEEEDEPEERIQEQEIDPCSTMRSSHNISEATCRQEVSRGRRRDQLFKRT